MPIIFLHACSSHVWLRCFGVYVTNNEDLSVNGVVRLGAGEGSNRRVSYRDMLVHDDDEDDADLDMGDGDDSPEATPPPVLRRPVTSTDYSVSAISCFEEMLPLGNLMPGAAMHDTKPGADFVLVLPSSMLCGAC
jgi:hypothetical protein